MLDLERAKSTLPKKQLSTIIYGSKQKHEYHLSVQKYLQDDPILRNDPSHLSLSRAELMVIYAKKLIRFHEKYPVDIEHLLLLIRSITTQVPLSLHLMMFITTLKNLCDDEQRKLFLEPTERGEIIGCYAQTELAHGSDVQNLMTQAVYEESTQSFIINTPTVGAAKWWIGDLGVYCTHACVFAQLIIKNKRYGVHAFLVPIRDEKHQLLPGVQAGDVGPKMGFNNKDNGYVIFTNFHIPRKNMLMKYHKVSKKGDYELRGDEKVSYATMLMVRAALPSIAFDQLSKTVTIITRYSLVRSQFKDKSGREIPILDYQSQQEKVLPRIAECYATMFCQKRLNQLANEVFEEAKNGKFDRLNEAHSITSSAKAIFTKDVLRGMEIIRRAAGGHGYSMYSGLPLPILEVLSTYTLEGQYTVLMLQVARFLVKCLKNLLKGKQLPESATYLEQLNNQNKFTLDTKDFNELRNPETIRKIFLYHSCEKLRQASDKLTKGISEGLAMKEAWDHYANIELVDSAIAHSYLWIYQNYYEMVATTVKNEKIRSVIYKLLILYGLEKIIERSHFFYQTETITSATLKHIYQLREALFVEIRPQALILVQAFDFSDNTLMSAIGTADGKAYETLLDWSKNHNPVNLPENKKQIIEAIRTAKAQFKPHL